LAQLRTMKVPALLKLRDQVDAEIAGRRKGLERQLASLRGGGPAKISFKTPKHALTGRTVAPKYRDTSGNTWSGRGLPPKWMTAAIKGGAKRDDFLIAAKRKAKR
jgi:DNA-binding protein H-NS